MDFAISVEPALRAGAVSGAVVFVLMITARIMGLCTVNPTMALGWAVTRSRDNGTDMLGFLMLLVLSSALALAYAAGFAFWHASGWWRGCLISLPHLAATGVVVGIVSSASPDLRKELFPCARHHHVAYEVFVIMALHVVYGTVIGLLYAVPRTS